MLVIIATYHPVSPKSNFCASCKRLICLMYAIIDHLRNTYRLIELSHSPTKPPVRITSANFRASQRNGLAISRNSIRISSIVSSSYGSLFSVIDNLVTSIRDLRCMTINISINETSIYRELTMAFLNRQFVSVSSHSLWFNVPRLVFGINWIQKIKTINKKHNIETNRERSQHFFDFNKILFLVYAIAHNCTNGRFDFVNDNLRCIG